MEKISTQKKTTGVQKLCDGKYLFTIKKGSASTFVFQKQKRVSVPSDELALQQYETWYEQQENEFNNLKNNTDELKRKKIPTFTKFCKKEIYKLLKKEVQENQGSKSNKYVKNMADVDRVISVLNVAIKNAEFANKKLCDITKKDMEQYFRERKAVGRKNSTLRNYRSDISKVFKLANQYSILENNYNPTTSVDVGQIGWGKEQKTSLNSDDYMKVLNEIELSDLKPHLKVFFLTSLLSGMRRGEIIALEKNELDFNEATIYVHQTLIDYKSGNGDVIKTIKQGTKNGENRFASFNPKLKGLLANYLDYLNNLDYETKWRDPVTNVIHNSLFFNPLTKTTYSLHYFTKEWGKYRNKLFEKGILTKKTTLHDLRASFITYQLVSKKESQQVVASSVGHKDSRITEQVYANVVKEDIGKMAI